MEKPGSTKQSPPQSLSVGQALIGMLGMGLAAIGLLAMPLPFGEQWVRIACDLAHGPLFACLTLAFFFVITKAKLEPRVALLTIVAVGLAVLGGLMEIAQEYVGRSATWGDVKANLCGVVAGVSLWNTANPRCRRYRAWLIAIAVIAIALSWLRTFISLPGWGSWLFA